MIKKIGSIAVFILLAAFSALAQQTEEVVLQLNDTLYFDICDGEHYKYIDYYKKTRFEKEKMDFDTLYNWEFYDLFFATGDFDVMRMPCSFSGSYGIIKHIMPVKDEDGVEHTVFIAMIENGVSVAYIMDDAFLTEEILYAPK